MNTIHQAHCQAPINHTRVFVGLRQFVYEDGGINLICHLDYSPADRGIRQDGLQIEPDYPAFMTLYFAFRDGVEIYESLDYVTTCDIEAAALEYFGRG